MSLKNKLFIIFCFASLIFLFGCITSPIFEKVSFLTKDNVKIVGNHYSGNEQGVILIHMLGQNKESWKDFGEELNKNGFTVLAIDLRGHGESILKNNEKISYLNFSSEEFNGMTNDIEAAVNFMREKDKTKIALIGASIGANLAVKYSVEQNNVQKLVLLSPGLDYRGVTTDSSISLINVPILFAASNEDVSSAGATEALYEKAVSKKELLMLDLAGHGTNMLFKEELRQKIIEWLNQ